MLWTDATGRVWESSTEYGVRKIVGGSYGNWYGNWYNIDAMLLVEMGLFFIPTGKTKTERAELPSIEAPFKTI